MPPPKETSEQIYRRQFNTDWEIPSDAASTSGLRKILACITGAEGGLSAERIHARMSNSMRDGYIPSHDTIRKIIKSTKKVYPFKNVNEYITLVYFIGLLSGEEKSLFNSLEDSDAIAFRHYCDQYFEIRSRDVQFRDRYLLREGPWAGRSSAAALDLLSTLNSLGLTRELFLSVDRVAFSEAEVSTKENTEKHYLAYRFGVEPGRVFKSRLSMSRLAGEHSPVKFVQVLRDRLGNLRTTSGFALSISARLYLIGNVDLGAALEVAAFSNFNPQRPLIGGLILTVSAVGELLASRLAIKRVMQKPNDEEIVRGPYDEFKTEIDQFRKMLANEIDFSLLEQLFFDGRKISQDAMVEEVAALLRNKDGEARFTYDDGREFNPAASEHYTFNSALREFR